jgi:predicted amino acid dehydrogenase
MAGDSHTNFDAGAFTAGAVGGAATIAGAIGVGIANFAAGRRERGVLQSRDATIFRLEQRIANQRTELGRRDATIRDQALTIRELDLRLNMAQYLRQRRS